MKKEIDFSKAPEGATHYTEASDAIEPFMMLLNGKWYWRGAGSWREHSDQRDEHIESAKPIPPEYQWTIHNNTKPLNELCGWQVLKIVNSMFDLKNRIEVFTDGSWKEFNPASILNGNRPYRVVREKSERELFVDAAEQMACNRGIAAQMFDSGKFKLVKD